MHRLAAVDGHVLAAPDDERPEPPRDLRVDARPFLALDAEAEPGLEGIVEQGQVGPVVAVALLHPQRVERPVAARPDPVFLAGCHQPVPHLAGPRWVDVQLPAKLTYISDPLG